MVDRATVLQLAAASGFRPETLEKVLRLGEMLGDVGGHALLGDRLALKGGTALNLLFPDPPRLSVDLDFNYVGSEDRETMRAERPLVERAIGDIARFRGYRLQWSPEEHAGRKVHLLYRGVAGVADRIEIDLNFMFRVPLAPVLRRTLWQPGEIARPTALVVADEEIAAGKLCATLARALPRDLFDTLRLPALLGERWATTAFRRLFVALAGLLDHPLHAYDERRLARVTDAIVASQLAPVLAAGTQPSARELREAAWEVLAPLLALDEAAREYSDRLQRGELALALLFPDDPETAARLARHPVLLWKQQNAAGHQARRGAGRPLPAPE